MVENAHEVFPIFQTNIFEYIRHMRGLTPQKLKPEFTHHMKNNTPLEEFKKDWFQEFRKGKETSWQQFLTFRSVQLAVTGHGLRKISIVSGHGTGKTASLAIIIIRFLRCFPESKIGATANTADQLHDVLWAEIKTWIDRIGMHNKDPKEESYFKWARSKLQWTAGHIRNSEKPETWFARAKTSRPEQPEALAGLHAEHLLLAVEEASGVCEDVFITAQGALTNENTIVIMISNGTRNDGYFYNSHNRNKGIFQTLSYNSEESPIVSAGYLESMLELSDGDPDDDIYRVRVKGMFPKSESLDSRGYAPVIPMNWLIEVNHDPYFVPKKLGVDPAGEGGDETIYIGRDNFRAKILLIEKKGNSKHIAYRTASLMDQYGIAQEDVMIDNFGEGANVGKELGLVGLDVNCFNVGRPAYDKKTFENQRAELSRLMRTRIKKGGELEEHKKRDKELPIVKFRRNDSGRIQIMSKRDIRKEFKISPGVYDALMLTFLGEEQSYTPVTPTTTVEADWMED